MEQGKLSFFTDSIKFGEHIVSSLGVAFENMKGDRDSRTLHPCIGMRKGGDRVTLNHKWVSMPGVSPRQILSDAIDVSKELHSCSARESSGLDGRNKFTTTVGDNGVVLPMELLQDGEVKITGNGAVCDHEGFLLTLILRLQYVYEWSAVAENVDAGQINVADVMVSWIHSPGYLTNIMGYYTMFGSAYAFNKHGEYQHYWTQEFGSSDTDQCDSSEPVNLKETSDYIHQKTHPKYNFGAL
ncbi:hypothetical protein PsorP6_003130 [Peronosclerospora sorghi]|uniref:Uncharacterized protein n=1 Tax=Peronosclerospora sorghi TaxID=230839 RepID=A0ACC0VPA3_9STRA|nr:hypothetical protein PsorP6_003130 [Peronosclerospora sorghi]